MSRIVGIFVLGLAALIALGPVETRAAQDPLGDLLPPTPCNSTYCIPAAGLCYGPGQGHCVQTLVYAPFYDANGDWKLGPGTPSCMDFPCLGGWVDF